MKVGMRKPSIKKSFKARTTGKAKRKIKKAVIPGYGKKGMGWVKNPKKAAYNKVYNKTTFSVTDVIGGSKSSSSTSSKGCLSSILIICFFPFYIVYWCIKKIVEVAKKKSKDDLEANDTFGVYSNNDFDFNDEPSQVKLIDKIKSSKKAKVGIAAGAVILSLAVLGSVTNNNDNDRIVADNAGITSAITETANEKNTDEITTVITTISETSTTEKETTETTTVTTTTTKPTTTTTQPTTTTTKPTTTATKPTTTTTTTKVALVYSTTKSEETTHGVTVPESDQTGDNLVWVPTNGGTKYHNNPTCSKMKDPRHITIDEAEKNGYTPCGRCY